MSLMKKNDKKEKKMQINSADGKYEFANDQLGENRESQFEELRPEERGNKKRGKK